MHNDEALYTPPLGVQAVPDVKMTQFRVSNGTRIAFGTPNLADLSSEMMRNALMSVDIGTVLVGFKELARLQMTLMVVEFVLPGTPTSPASADEGVSPVTDSNTEPRSAIGVPSRRTGASLS